MPADDGPVEPLFSTDRVAEKAPLIRHGVERSADKNSYKSATEREKQVLPDVTVLPQVRPQTFPADELSVMVKRSNEIPLDRISPVPRSSAREEVVPVERNAPSKQVAASHALASQPVEVHVTIGHIEVRSAPPAAAIPPPRVARPRTGMSLDDYLQRRNGGAR